MKQQRNKLCVAHPGSSAPEHGKGLVIRWSTAAAVLLFLPFLALAIAFALLRPLLNSTFFLRLAEDVLSRQTGATCQVAALHFQYPFTVDLRGLWVSGETGSLSYSIYVPSARLESSLQGLLHTRVQQVLSRGLQVNLEFVRAQGEGTSASSDLEGTVEDVQALLSFRAPEWLWKIGTARVLRSALQIAAGSGALCFEDLSLIWSASPDGEQSGTLALSLGGVPESEKNASLAHTPSGPAEEIPCEPAGPSPAAHRSPADEDSQPTQANTLLITVEEDRVVPESGTLCIHAELSDLLHVAGSCLPASGMITAVASGSPGADSGPVLTLDLFSDNLHISNPNGRNAFGPGRASATFCLQLPDLDKHQGLKLYADLSTSAAGLNISGVSLASRIQPLEAVALLAVETGPDLVSWLLDIYKSGSARIATTGVLEGLLAQSIRIDSSTSITCTDPDLLPGILTAWVRLPGGSGFRGSLETEAVFSGSLARADLKGSVNCSRAWLKLPETQPLTLDLQASFEGAMVGGRFTQAALMTNTLRAGNLQVRQLKVDYLESPPQADETTPRPTSARWKNDLDSAGARSAPGDTPVLHPRQQAGSVDDAQASASGAADTQPPERNHPSGGVLHWRASIENTRAEHAALFLGSWLPAAFRGFEWGGEFDLDTKGVVALPSLDELKAEAFLRLRQGQFRSSDFQHMAERVDLRLTGTASRHGPRFPVEFTTEVAVTGGEWVYGGFYGNLTLNRPRVRAEGRVLPDGSLVELRSLTLSLEEIGDLLLSGRISGRESKRTVAAKARVKRLNLKGASQLFQDALGGIYPRFSEAECSGALDLDLSYHATGDGRAVAGLLRLEDARLNHPPSRLSVSGVQAEIPFSLGSLGRSQGDEPRVHSPVELQNLHARDAGKDREEHDLAPGRIRVEEFMFKGIQGQEVNLSLLVDRDRLELLEPIELEIADGRMVVHELMVDRILAGNRRGTIRLDARELDARALSAAFLGYALGGHFSAHLEQGRFDDGGWSAKGDLRLTAGNGHLAVEHLDLQFPSEGPLEVRCRVSAESMPIEDILGDWVKEPYAGMLSGDLGTLKVSRGQLSAPGRLDLDTLGGRLSVMKITGDGIPGPEPSIQADLDIKEIDLSKLTYPLEFGRISGVLNGRVEALELTSAFPYAKAFRLDLQTVKRPGIPQRIDATAVRSLSKIGGSNALSAALSGGLYRYFDEYYYSKMGLRAVLKDGLLDLHGIPSKGKEYLILRALRPPSISMPIQFVGADRSIHFKSWLKNLASLTTGQPGEPHPPTDPALQ